MYMQYMGYELGLVVNEIPRWVRKMIRGEVKPAQYRSKWSSKLLPRVSIRRQRKIDNITEKQ